MNGASNRLIDVEDLSERELDALHRHYRTLVEMARRDDTLTASHSVEEAQAQHERKLRARSIDKKPEPSAPSAHGHIECKPSKANPKAGGSRRESSKEPGSQSS